MEDGGLLWTGELVHQSISRLADYGQPHHGGMVGTGIYSRCLWEKCGMTRERDGT